MREITNSDDIIDSRDVIERIQELEASLAYEYDEDESAELTPLHALQEKAECAEDWQYGATLIRDSYFTEYARQYAEDLGYTGNKIGWPFDYIDWDEAATALLQNYNSVDFDGVEYWVR
jgi:hypothetical protein